MTVLTILMLVAFLCLIPLRIAVAFRLDFNKKCLFAEISVFWIGVFREKFAIEGQYLVCTGTVDTNIQLFSVNGKSGVNLAKALVWDSVNVTFATDYTKTSPYTMLVLENFCRAATAVACGISHCRVHTETCFSVENAIFGEVIVSVSLAEILLVLAQERIRIWKMNKSAQ